MNRFVLIAVAIALAVHARQEKEAPPLTSRESMAEEVTIETLAGGGSVFSSHAQKLLRVSVSSKMMLDFGKREKEEGGNRLARSYSVFPDFFAELVVGGDQQQGGGGGRRGEGSRKTVLPLKKLGLEFCSGRWQPEWGVDDNSGPCRGHAISAVFDSQGQEGSFSDRHLPCKSWVRVLNALSSTFSTSYSQVHPLACDVSANKSPFDGTTTATLAPVHKRHIYTSSDRNEKALAEQQANNGKESGGGSSSVAYFTGIPLESFCSDNLGPMMKMLPGLFWMQKSNRREEVERRPKGVWSKFVPNAKKLFAQGFKRLNTQLVVDANTSLMELSVSLQYVIPEDEFLEDISAHPTFAAASDFSASSTLEVQGGKPYPSSQSQESRQAAVSSPSAVETIDLKSREDDETSSSSSLEAKLGALLDMQWESKGKPLEPVEGHTTKKFGSTEEYEHCGVIKQFVVQQRGEVDGSLKIVVQTRDYPNEEDPVYLRLVIPLHIMRPLIHSLEVEQDLSYRMELLRVAKNLKPDTVTILIRLVRTLDGSSADGAGDAVLTMRYLPPFVNVNHYPPDANKAYWIPSAVAFYAPRPLGGNEKEEGAVGLEGLMVGLPQNESSGCLCQQQHPHHAAMSELLRDDLSADGPSQDPSTPAPVLGWCVESSQDATVVSLPIPDVSMPFNVLAVGCGVFAVFYGTIFAMTARNML